jgi:hypothetical protein
MMTLGLPGLLLVLGVGPNPAGVIPAAIFALFASALMLTGMN